MFGYRDLTMTIEKSVNKTRTLLAYDTHAKYSYDDCRKLMTVYAALLRKVVIVVC